MDLLNLDPRDFPKTRKPAVVKPLTKNPLDELREKVLRIGETFAGIDYWTHAFGSGDSDFPYIHGPAAGKAGDEICNAYSLVQSKLSKMKEFAHPEVFGALNTAGKKKIHEEFPNLVDLEVANALLHFSPMDENTKYKIQKKLLSAIHLELKTHGSERLLSKTKTPAIFDMGKFLLENKVNPQI